MTFARPYALLTLILLAMAVAGCSSTGTRKSGGYYQNDGPEANPPNVDNVPDAVPRIEPLAAAANRPYTVFGKRYVPDASEASHKERGIASWYGKQFHGKRTSIGEKYDMYAMTAAHPTMPLPSYARVTSMINGRTVVVRVNDRGPFHSKRIMDLSYAAARRLGIIGPGSGEIVVERITPGEIRLTQSQSRPAGAQARPATTAAPIAVAAADPAGGAPVLATRDAQAQGGIYLQVGAFSQSANAQSLLSRVNDQLGSAGDLPSATIQQSDRIYRVRIGPYADRAAALSAVERVADRTGILPSLSAP